MVATGFSGQCLRVDGAVKQIAIVKEIVTGPGNGVTNYSLCRCDDVSTAIDPPQQPTKTIHFVPGGTFGYPPILPLAEREAGDGYKPGQPADM
ncbi:hypothetical protein ACO22_07847 [Paracoccidioides brasiliensis]|uniref:Uncharacterized protein n=1 Tax=Paracoccidioides brasiliensis TaxID=121759 RepID=A0A1D2J3J0_PARBR|nr:hypothetical protein ACO22_07847 [Paracoccidioides brasiliensis]